MTAGRQFEFAGRFAGVPGFPSTTRVAPGGFVTRRVGALAAGLGSTARSVRAGSGSGWRPIRSAARRDWPEELAPCPGAAVQARSEPVCLRPMESRQFRHERRALAADRHPRASATPLPFPRRAPQRLRQRGRVYAPNVGPTVSDRQAAGSGSGCRWRHEGTRLLTGRDDSRDDAADAAPIVGRL